MRSCGGSSAFPNVLEDSRGKGHNGELVVFAQIAEVQSQEFGRSRCGSIVSHDLSGHNTDTFIKTTMDESMFEVVNQVVRAQRTNVADRLANFLESFPRYKQLMHELKIEGGEVAGKTF